jgi:hypothetical protein
MTKLRSDAYIKISDSYRPVVSPLLFADERSETTPAKTTAQEQSSTRTSANKSSKKPKDQKQK